MQVPIQELLKHHWLQGRRMRKLPKFERKPPVGFVYDPLGSHYTSRADGVFQPFGVHVDPKVQGREILAARTEYDRYKRWRTDDPTPNDYRGNLPKHEYQFFVGNRYIRSPFSECRLCRTTCFGPSARRAHKEKRCHIELIRIFKELVKTQKCVVCGKGPVNTHWGVPLCKGGCTDVWKWSNQFVYSWHVQRPGGNGTDAT